MTPYERQKYDDAIEALDDTRDVIRYLLGLQDYVAETEYLWHVLRIINDLLRSEGIEVDEQ